MVLSLVEELIEAFNVSRAVARGGPGGFYVDVAGEIWNVGMAPSGMYFASNGVSGEEVTQFCSYHISRDGKLLRNKTAAYIGRGWKVDASADEEVTSSEEATWLISLIKAADVVDWGEKVDVPQRPAVQ